METNWPGHILGVVLHTPGTAWLDRQDPSMCILLSADPTPCYQANQFSIPS